MKVDEKLYTAFLEEMQQLERFRLQHAELFQGTPIDSDDPSTKRLIESLAFFGARARVQSEKRVNAIHQCLFRQYFPYMLNPLPATGMVQLSPSPKYPEKVFLQEGTGLEISLPNGSTAVFQTMQDATILPLKLDERAFAFEKRADHGTRCTLTYRLPFSSADHLEQLRLYIYQLGNYFTSLTAMFAMHRSLDSVTAYYDREAGKPCSFSFGQPKGRKTLSHPIEIIRSCLHCPEQELFFTVDLPPPDKRWESLTLHLDFNESWPDNLVLTQETLRPFVVPIANIRSDVADPIFCDGTKDQYVLLHPEPRYKFQLHTVQSVAKVEPTGIEVLNPGILGQTGDTYEIDYFNQILMLDIKDAFQSPKTVTATALWTQPWFAEYADEELILRFSKQQAVANHPKLLGLIQPYESTVNKDDDFLVRLLSLKNQNILDLGEILFLLGATKNIENSYFNIVPPLIKTLTIHQRIDDQHIGSVIEYEFRLKEWGGQKWEVVVQFFVYLCRFLNCWLSNFEVETKVIFPQNKKPLIIKGGTKDELSVLARDFFIA